MDPLLTCPHCGEVTIDLHDYRSMIVITEAYALFTVDCPACGMGVSSVKAIPNDMHDEVLYAAIEVGAGMGRTS